MTVDQDLKAPRATVTAALDGVPAPVPDVGVVRLRGRALRRRRRARRLATALALVSLVGVYATQLDTTTVTASSELGRPAGMLDASQGLRAIWSGDALYVGGTTVPVPDDLMLDISASATPEGVVYPDSGNRWRFLSATTSRDEPLLEPPARGENWWPSSAWDSTRPWVAVTRGNGDGVEVAVVELGASPRVVARRTVACGSSCDEVVVEAADAGIVFVRTDAGTFAWQPPGNGWTLVGAEDFRLADARGGRLLWSGTPPTPDPDGPVADWPVTKGAIDATLSLDGRYVLGWSPRLRPTGDDPPVRVDSPGAHFFFFDTDGSVLTADLKRRTTVRDCVLPSGRCKPVARMRTVGGDPQFLGADM